MSRARRYGGTYAGMRYRTGKKEKMPVWQPLTLLFLAAALACLPVASTRFGSAFFGVLAVGTGGEWLMIALHRQTEKRIFGAVAVLGRVLFVLFLASFVWIQSIILTGSRESPQAQQADCLLVLGAHVYDDGPSAALRARLDVAYDFLNAHPDAFAILCGGQGWNESRPEAVVMEEYLVARGIAAERLRIEDDSNNTIQNIANAKDLFLTGNETTAVVTNEFHLCRAKKLMTRAGLDPYGIPAPTPHWYVRFASHLREYCSILGLMVTGRWF
jgi:uncharacterized SAM-binding protein YcdF (DUF218 family)